MGHNSANETRQWLKRYDEEIGDWYLIRNPINYLRSLLVAYDALVTYTKAVLKHSCEYPMRNLNESSKAWQNLPDWVKEEINDT